MLDLGPWAALRHHFATDDRPRIAGISGGRTSAMMAALLDDRAVLSFQNTGREHPATYTFLERLEEALGRRITWLEYRPPARRGAPPAESRVEVVTARTADRSGAPFEMLLDALAAYRATKGKGPIAPWWRQRLCTTYMKTRLARRWVERRNWTTFDEVVGLRADEPARVQRLAVGVPRRIRRLAPLAVAGIDKAAVDAFWGAQAFDLELDAYLGNCTGCFLKDQADLSRALAIEATEAEWWVWIAAKYPGFGGQNFAGYQQLALEAPMRSRIENELRTGVAPAQRSEDPVDARRFRLVVIQERKRINGQVAPFSCACEGSDILASMDDDEENRFIAELPSEEEAA